MAMTAKMYPMRDDANGSTTDLIKEAIDDARELARLEAALAKNEVMEEVRALRVSAIAFGAAAAAGLSGAALLLVALVLALGGVIPALVIGIALLIVASGAAWIGFSMIPKKPLDATKHRLEDDVHQLKEHVA